MEYKTLLVTDIQFGIRVTLNRFEQRNTLNGLMLNELYHVLTEAEKNPLYRIVVLKGQQGIFCMGMDFHEVVQVLPQEKMRMSGVFAYEIA